MKDQGNQKIGQKIFTLALFAVGVLGFELISNHFLDKGQLMPVFLMLGGSFFGLCIYFKTKMKANMFQIISYFLVVGLFGVYIFYNLLNPILRVTTMFKDLQMTPEDITGPFGFLTIFSLAYGISQLFGGYILSKFKLYGYTGMMVFGALSILGIAMATAPAGCLYSRLASGVFLSVSGIVVSYYPATYWAKEHMNFLINSIIFLGIKLACVGASIMMSRAIADPTIWRDLVKTTSFTIIGFSIVFVLFVSIFGKSTTPSSEETKSENKNGESIVGEFIGLIIKDKRIILACLLCAFTVADFYFFRYSGYLIDLVKSYFPTENAPKALDFMNNVQNYCGLFGPMLLAFISVETLILFFCGLQCAAVVLMILKVKTSFALVNFAALGLGAGMSAHCFLPLIFGRDYSNKKSIGLLFAILNFFPMFFGSYVGQKVGIYLTQASWKATGAKMINGQQVLSGDNIMYAIQYMLPTVILAFVISIYLFSIRNNKSQIKD